jgi:protein-tyrosine phosphatase
MVCLGNICRSPTAHGVLEKMINNKGLAKLIEVDSAGTSSYHIGSHPDPRSIAAAARRGYMLQQQRARQVSSNDYYEFDHILAMDRENLNYLRAAAPSDCHAKIQLLLDYSPVASESVPDPYFAGGEQGFENVLDLVEAACQRLLQQIEQGLKPPSVES